MTDTLDYIDECRRRLNEIVVAIDHDAISDAEGIDAMIDLLDDLLARVAEMHTGQP